MPIEYKNKVLHLYSLLFEIDTYIKKSFDYTISEFERMHDREGKQKNAQTIFIQSFYKSLQQVFVRSQVIKNSANLYERFQDLQTLEINKWIKLMSKSHFDQICILALYVFFKIEFKDICSALDINFETAYFRMNQILHNLETISYES